MLPDKIRQALNDAGLAEYKVKRAGKLTISSPGYMLGCSDKGECSLTYQTDANVPCRITDSYLDCYTGILRAAGLLVRPAAHVLALLVTERRAPALTMVARPVFSRPPVEEYRHQLVRETAGMFRAAIRARRARGEYLTPEGAHDIRRKMQSILGASETQLEHWRQRAV